MSIFKDNGVGLSGSSGEWNGVWNLYGIFWGSKSRRSSSPPPSLQLLPLPFPFLPFPPPSLSPSSAFPFLSSHPLLRSRTLKIQLVVLVSAVSFPSGVWGGAAAEIEFGAFYP